MRERGVRKRLVGMVWNISLKPRSGPLQSVDMKHLHEQFSLSGSNIYFNFDRYLQLIIVEGYKSIINCTR
jgi:hypothetical protein